MAPRDELKLCGLAAVRARFQRDAASIRRLYFDESTGRKVGLICKALAGAKKIYRQVDAAELEKISGTVHHGGIVAVVPDEPLRAPTASEVRRWAAGRQPVLLLDRIGNAHNLGAIARTAAFFGVQHLVIPQHATAAVPNEAAYRIAEGGLEFLTVWRTPELAPFIASLRTVGYDVAGAATRGGGVSTHGTGPVALVVGNEETGLAPDVAKACSRLVTLAGSGQVESLNVSVATGVLLHALVAAPKSPRGETRGARG